MLDFSCDYNVGVAPEILEEMIKINDDHEGTYGFDKYSESAAQKIKKEIGNPDAEVWFMVGGTPTNMIALDAMLIHNDGVLAADTAHVSTHEAGAIEATGHKVIAVNSHPDGRIDVEAAGAFLKSFHGDGTKTHQVYPKVMYISQPTEHGGLYTLKELKELRKLCDKYGMRLYIDGARLAYGLMAEKNDVTLKDLGKYADAFYIGGTKCGAYIGEALVFKKAFPNFFSIRKQRGGLLAKGWLLSLQFDVMFTDGLYYKLGKNAIDRAMQLKKGLKKIGIEFMCDSPTNQQFVYLTDRTYKKISKTVKIDTWSKENGKTCYRICTNWKTSKEDIDKLIETIKKAAV